MTLLLWKGPVVEEPDEAEALLKPYYEHGDESGFEPSPDVATVARELLRRFPDDEDGPWGDAAVEESDRILYLNIRWSASDAFMDAITDLAREHELVLYDPQGPDLHLPNEPIDNTPVPEPGLGDRLKILLLTIPAAALVWLGWWIDVPVLGWLLMIMGAFFLAVIVYVFVVALGPDADTNDKLNRVDGE
jgi:hypothetical protein